MNRTPPAATAPAAKPFGVCKGCGTKVSPGASQCEMCARRDHYFGGTNEPNGPQAEDAPPYGRNV